ncbi:MAG: ABC transporter substrate-binding protein [Alphaproteobacteria bacterium]|nr:ABC transporter substrate-binding protein [Alphaproteobacteria bacterium]
MIRMPKLWATAAIAIAALAIAAPSRGQVTLNVVAEAEMRSLDPIWTTAGVVYAHGAMVYDMLYGQDESGAVHPQMVGSHTVSPDGLTWTFKLRPGLKWHDGTSVAAKDIVPSIKRWAARMAVGAALMSRVAEMTVVDADTWQIVFKEKFGPVTEVLANSGTPLFIMREKDANVDPFQQVTDSIGSGPFIFNKDEWKPGAQWFYRKNPNYVGRSEPAAGHGGNKTARTDRVVWTYLPDPAIAIQALSRGEMDIIQFPPSDLMPMLRQNPNVKVEITNKLGRLAILRPNHLVAPMDNPKILQAMLYAIDQSQHLNAVVGVPAQEIVCWTALSCRTSLETKEGLGDFAKPSANIEKAKQPLKESGYKNEPLVLMNPTDQPQITIFVRLADQQLRQAGFNIDMQSMDWATLVSRRSVKDAPSANRAGWHLFVTTSTATFQGDPIANNALNTGCDGKNWFGWPCDPELDKIRAELIAAAGKEQRLEISGRLNKRFYETVPYVNLGQFTSPAAFRSNISGIIDIGYHVLWAVEKK